MNNGIELDDALRQFYGGDQVYRYPFGRSVYTEGIKFFCENAGGGAYWLLDILMTEPAILQEMRQRGIVFVRLTVTGSKAVLIVNADDGEPPLFTQHLEYIDCPAKPKTEYSPKGEWMFYFENDTLMLPGER